MKKEEKMRRLLEWLVQELEGELARIQKEKEHQEDFLLRMVEEVQHLLD